MTTLSFRSPSGKGIARAIVQEKSGFEYVEVELTLFREMMGDLGFEEVDPDTPIEPIALYVDRKPSDSGSDRG